MRRPIKAALAATTLAAASLLGTGTASAHYLDCSGSSATSCGHWSGNGYGNPHVWVEDTTGSRWPVYDATTQWNQGSYLDVYYQYNSHSNATANGDHWFGVYEYNSNDGALGLVGGICDDTRGCFWTGHFVNAGGTDGHPFVKLNNYYTTTATARMHVACQEIGHAFGLAHQYNDPTCMDNSNLTDTNVGTHAWNDLNDLYSHITSSNPNG